MYIYTYKRHLYLYRNIHMSLSAYLHNFAFKNVYILAHRYNYRKLCAKHISLHSSTQNISQCKHIHTHTHAYKVKQISGLVRKFNYNVLWNLYDSRRCSALNSALSLIQFKSNSFILM